MATIHPTAIVHPEAKLGKSVVVEAYAVIQSPHVILEEGVVVKSHALIEGRVRVGKNTVIWPFASIGTQPQDLKYRGEVTYVEIGENCQIRESVTINSSCGEGTKVVVGNRCMIMAYCHVAHNCTLGDGVIMANSATLAGHVTIGDHAILGGLSAIHQHTRIGAHAMLGGGSMVGQDLPPFCLGSGFPMRVIGLNVIGLKRHKFSLQERKELIRAYRLTLQSDSSWSQVKTILLNEFGRSKHIQEWISFCDTSSRGIALVRNRKKTAPADAGDLVDIR